MKLDAGLVTGAGGFLGLEHCKSVLDLNHVLIMVDKNNVGLQSNFKLLKSIYKKQKIIKVKCDITKEKNIKNLYDKLKLYFVRIIINNAAIDSVPTSRKSARLKNFPQWNKEFLVGLKAPCMLIEQFKEPMIKNKNGCIVNIASDLSVIAPNQEIYKNVYNNYTKPVTYSIIKHGLIGLTKYYASLLAKHSITCNAISPTGVKKNHKKKFISNIVKLIPMNRMACISDIKYAIDFLVNQKQKFITGQNIIIDGGRTII